jgi:hypothetical protein
VKKKIIESMNQLVPRTVELKVGAQVMLLRNYYGKSGNSRGRPELANGSRGIVVRFDVVPTSSSSGVLVSSSSDVGTITVPVVRFDNGQVLAVHPVEHIYQEMGKKTSGSLIRRQIPLKLAW